MPYKNLLRSFTYTSACWLITCKQSEVSLFVLMEIKTWFFLYFFGHILFHFQLRHLLNKSHIWGHQFFIDQTVQNVHISTARNHLHSSLWHFIKVSYNKCVQTQQNNLYSVYKCKHKWQKSAKRWRLKQHRLTMGTNTITSNFTD